MTRSEPHNPIAWFTSPQAVVCYISLVLAVATFCVQLVAVLACVPLGVVLAWYLARVIPKYTANPRRKSVSIGTVATFGAWGPFGAFPVAFAVQIIGGEGAVAALAPDTQAEIALSVLVDGILTAGVVGWAFRAPSRAAILGCATVFLWQWLRTGNELGFAVALPSSMFLWNVFFMIAFSPQAARRAFSRPAGRCGECGYCTYGLPSATCPECGNLND